MAPPRDQKTITRDRICPCLSGSEDFLLTGDSRLRAKPIDSAEVTMPCNLNNQIWLCLYKKQRTREAGWQDTKGGPAAQSPPCCSVVYPGGSRLLTPRPPDPQQNNVPRHFCVQVMELFFLLSSGVLALAPNLGVEIRNFGNQVFQGRDHVNLFYVTVNFVLCIDKIHIRIPDILTQSHL